MRVLRVAGQELWFCLLGLQLERQTRDSFRVGGSGSRLTSWVFGGWCLLFVFVLPCTLNPKSRYLTKPCSGPVRFNSLIASCGRASVWQWALQLLSEAHALGGKVCFGFRVAPF